MHNPKLPNIQTVLLPTVYVHLAQSSAINLSICRVVICSMVIEYICSPMGTSVPMQGLLLPCEGNTMTKPQPEMTQGIQSWKGNNVQLVHWISSEIKLKKHHCTGLNPKPYAGTYYIGGANTNNNRKYGDPDIPTPLTFVSVIVSWYLLMSSSVGMLSLIDCQDQCI